MIKGVAITGMGIISSIGNNVNENYTSLITGSPGITNPFYLKTSHTGIPVGEIKKSNKALAKMAGLADTNSFTRAALLGLIAAREAATCAGLNAEELKSTGFISASSVGGMDMTEEYFDKFKEVQGNFNYIQAQHPGFTTGLIAKKLGTGGFVTTVSTACSSSANAIMLGARMIKAGRLKRVIVGGTDCLTKFTLNGFNSLMILSPEECKPFDHNRNGLNLGEGAAFMVLEAEGVLKNKSVKGRVSGYGNANDAFHQTASSGDGEGAFLAMEKALMEGGFKPGDIDYINAHGTATKNNDLSESIAIQRLFAQVPPLSSTKAFTGHTLAAAGSIEGVFCLLSLEKDRIFPNLNFLEAMQETGMTPVTYLLEKRLKHILSNSFGFGGNCTSLIYSKDEA